MEIRQIVPERKRSGGQDEEVSRLCQEAAEDVDEAKPRKKLKAKVFAPDYQVSYLGI
jgi:hypothetical protein